MMTWDSEHETVGPFGHLKTAALSERYDQSTAALKPLFRAFDILYLNDRVLTQYQLRDRHRALEAAVKPIPHRFEIHAHTEGVKAEDIDRHLRTVVIGALEGLVLKNPRSMYSLNKRNDAWIKVKPGYMADLGETLDCLVIGGYYGSGRRSGRLTSFLCGLRIDDGPAFAEHSASVACSSFFRVGLGFSDVDLQLIEHRTEGRWKKWDSQNPPTLFIKLAGDGLQYERPDLWIQPEHSVVLCTLAAQIIYSNRFHSGRTLRFARFKSIREDKGCRSALSVRELRELETNGPRGSTGSGSRVDGQVDMGRAMGAREKGLTIAGYESSRNDRAPAAPGSASTLFDGLTFHVITGATSQGMSKPELEDLVRCHGGRIVQTQSAVENTVCIADRKVLRAASVIKAGETSIVLPVWLFDCIKQNEINTRDGTGGALLLWEPRHMFHLVDRDSAAVADSVDCYGDPYYRDVGRDELMSILNGMPGGPLPGQIFRGLVLYFDES